MNTKKTTIPVNSNAAEEVRNVINYLGEISGRKLITGQHTKTKAQLEIDHIRKVTGELPALCGFELLSYSPNIDFINSDEECLKEVRENMGTLETAMEWAENRRGLLTFTWHWFSPVGGCHKSFYTDHTDFNPEQALISGTIENIALLSDMDSIAEQLKLFQEKNIPILWRPFHESEGNWFWWGSKSFEVSKQLYRLMYDRYTNYHKLDNLIWVWNSPEPSGYPGDDVVDIISRDLYPLKHTHTDFKKEYEELIRITTSDKLAALGENGPIPGVEMLSQTRVPWCWYMTWCEEFCIGEEWTTSEELKRMYEHEYAVTLDKLPKLY